MEIAVVGGEGFFPKYMISYFFSGRNGKNFVVMQNCFESENEYFCLSCSVIFLILT